MTLLQMKIKVTIVFTSLWALIKVVYKDNNVAVVEPLDRRYIPMKFPEEKKREAVNTDN